MTMPAAYAVIKGGMINFTRYLASYLGAYNIRVNAVSPGGILDNQPDVFVKQYSEKVPLKRMGLPEDVSPVIVFLMSRGAAYITGQNMVVDGGWTAV
jgi:NAD(P)-dependent dehydrogenase (short-subunit alcohol dehydrogenase family)